MQTIEVVNAVVTGNSAHSAGGNNKRSRADPRARPLCKQAVMAARARRYTDASRKRFHISFSVHIIAVLGIYKTG